MGYGCAAIDGYDYGAVDDRDSEGAIRRALDLGIAFFDTADVYGLGRAECVLSRALGSRRHGVFVSTKFGVAWDERGRTWRDTSPARVSAALHESLRRLRLECIPLYQIHWPDGTTPIRDTLAVLLRHKEEGKIGAIGICNVARHAVAEALASCRIESLRSRLASSSAIMRMRSSSADQASVSAYWPTTRSRRGFSREAPDARRPSRAPTSGVAANYSHLKLGRGGCGLSSVSGSSAAGMDARRRRLRSGGFSNTGMITLAITGAKTMTQITENAGGSDWSLAPDEVAFLQAPLSISSGEAHVD